MQPDKLAMPQAAAKRRYQHQATQSSRLPQDNVQANTPSHADYLSSKA
jgi:hypothetical protein